jgi:MIP family channel proteins
VPSGSGAILPAMAGPDLIRRGLAEFIGTFCLVFVSAGSLIYGDPVVSALAYGFAVLVMVSSFAQISGGHFNPAVTLGFLVTRRIPASLAVFYAAVQLAGATVAALLLKYVLPPVVKNLHLGAPTVSVTIDASKAVTIEAVITFFLVLVFFATAVDPSGAFDRIAGVAIGLTVAFGFMMAGGLTGGVMNPARAFGPELVSGHWTNWWVWWVGPLAGGALAAVLYEVLYLGRRSDEEERAGPVLADDADDVATDAPA